MTGRLPEDLVRKLNRLGFALVEGEAPYTFVRLGPSHELRVLVESLGADTWRVGMASRSLDEPGRAANPVLALDLSVLGDSTDGTTVDLPTADLRETLPRVVRDCILPRWDFGPV